MLLDCDEEVFWVEKCSCDDKEEYSRKRKTYHDEAILATLRDGIKPDIIHFLSHFLWVGTCQRLVS